MTTIGQKLTLSQKILLRQFKKPIIVFDNLPNELQIENSYGVPNSSWNEPIECWHVTHQFIMEDFLFIPWEDKRRPILGVWFDGNEWQPMFGYKEPHFAPGYSWEEEFIPRQYRNKHEFDYDWFNKLKTHKREYRYPAIDQYNKYHLMKKPTCELCGEEMSIEEMEKIGNCVPCEYERNPTITCVQEH